MALQFSHRCGKNIAVKDGGLVVEKIKFGNGYGGVFTNRPLQTSERFEVESTSILGYPFLSLGITTWSPEKVKIPRDMEELTPSWMVYLGGLTGGGVKVNGRTVQKVLSGDEVEALKKGDKLALMVTPEKELIFFVKGEQVAKIVITAKATYGFINLWGYPGDSVRLIPDLREASLRRPLQLLESEHRHLQQQLQESERQQEGLLELLQDSERQKDELQQQLYARESQRDRLQLQLLERESQQDGLQQQLQQRNREQLEFQRELQRVQTENQQLTEQHQTESQQLRATIDQLRQQIASLQAPRVLQQTHHTEFWEVPRGDVTLNIQRILGTGGWGYVVEGRFRGQTVAVKCLHDLIREPAFTAVIRREIGIMTQLRHPNLVLLIAAVIDEEVTLIITELLELSLRTAYERNRLDAGERCKLSIFHDVASALNYLHLHHHGPIIHRDVSSANVLLESRPRGQWRAKLSDFGSAKLAREATTTGPGAVVYAAPEVRRDTGIRQSPKVDVYSYGVLLCEVGVGQFPLEGRFPAMLQSLAQRGPLLHRLVSSCTQELPDNRPSMADILADLDRALEN